MASWHNKPHAELALLRTIRWSSWPVDTLYIWTNEQAVTHLLRLVEERWQPSETEVLLPESMAMTFANLSDKDNRVLFVWWD